MWRRIGLQRRIMAYVTVGLVLMFGAFAYVGLQAVQRSTQMVFQERLNVARSIAAAIDQSLDYLASDIEAYLAEQPPGYSARSPQEAVEQALARLASAQAALLSVVALELRDRRGELVAVAPEGLASAIAPQTLTLEITSTQEKPPLVTSGVSGTSEAGVSALFIVPLSSPSQEEGGDLVAVAHLERAPAGEHLNALLRNGMAGEGDEVATGSQAPGYGIELIDKAGNVLLASGAVPPADASRGHLSLLRDLPGKQEATVSVHPSGQGAGQPGHVMAAVPMPRRGLYLILEQNRDVALALPDELRRRIILFDTLGFLGALAVAWVTTRHVVHPTEELASAAARIGQGDLDTPVNVTAQDEVGKLADVLEVMRQRLQVVLHELEKANRGLEARVRERTAHLEQLMGKVISAQEEERRRLARELHDETAQALATLSLALAELLEGLPQEGERVARAREAKTLADNLLEETRRLIYALRPSVLDDMGLVPALRWYAEEQLEKRGIRVSLETKGLPDDLPEYVKVALFRIAQEAMANAAKHAGANTVQLRLRKLQEIVVLEVEDDGAGFNPETFSRTSLAHRGVGLAGMEERAVALGGKLTLRSAPGEGTSVQARIPLVQGVT